MSADTLALAQPEQGFAVVFYMAFADNAYCQIQSILRRASVGLDRVGVLVGKADPEGLIASAEDRHKFQMPPQSLLLTYNIVCSVELYNKYLQA